MRAARQLWLPLIPAIVVTMVAEALVRYGVIPTYILPAPTDILGSLSSDTGEYLTAAATTLAAATTGLLLSALGGVFIALVLSSSHVIERALYPYAVFFQTVPIIAIAPLLVIWFGFGLPTVIVSAFIVSVFPVIANTLAGLRSAPQPLQDLFRLYGATRFDELRKLKLPCAVPQIVTGIRIAGGLAMIGAIVGEFIAGGGLGGLIDMARTQQRLDKVFAAVLIASFLGIFIVALLNLFFRLTLKRWHSQIL